MRKAGGITTLHHRLRKLILEGVYPPGARLSERELAQTLGVSRTPLREVLRMLGREGLVETGRYQRARVAPLDPVALDMLYAGRIQLETLGLALTIPCLQEEDFAELDAALLRHARGYHDGGVGGAASSFSSTPGLPGRGTDSCHHGQLC